MAGSYRSPKTRVRASPIHGRGLFAVRPIRRGEIVAVKGGHILDRRALARSPARAAVSYIQIDDDLYIGAVTRDEVPPQQALHQSLLRAQRRHPRSDHLRRAPRRRRRRGADLRLGHGGERRAPAPAVRARRPSCRKILTGRDWQLPALQRRYRGFFSAYLAAKIAGASPAMPRGRRAARRAGTTVTKGGAGSQGRPSGPPRARSAPTPRPDAVAGGARPAVHPQYASTARGVRERAEGGVAGVQGPTAESRHAAARVRGRGAGDQHRPPAPAAGAGHCRRRAKPGGAGDVASDESAVHGTAIAPGRGRARRSRWRRSRTTSVSTASRAWFTAKAAWARKRSLVSRSGTSSGSASAGTRWRTGASARAPSRPGTGSRHLDLHGLEVGDLGSRVGPRPPGHGVEEQLEGALRGPMAAAPAGEPTPPRPGCGRAARS